MSQTSLMGELRELTKSESFTFDKIEWANQIVWRQNKRKFSPILDQFLLGYFAVKQQ
jgi:hypothetical protein